MGGDNFRRLSTTPCVFQVLVLAQCVLIPSGFRVERLRVGKGGEFIIEDFQDYFLRTGCRASTPAHLSRSKLACPNELEDLFPLVHCMLLDSGLLRSMCGQLMFSAAFLGNRAPHSAIGMQYLRTQPFTERSRTRDLFEASVVGPSGTIRPTPQTLDLKAVEGRLVGYNKRGNRYRVYHPDTRHIMAGQNVTSSRHDRPSRQTWKKIRSR